MGKNAVTLMELLVVIVIISILAAIAVPIYTNRIERTKGERAIVNIELIKDTYKQYYTKYGTHPTFESNDLIGINKAFNLELSDSNFSYSINTQGTAPNTYQQIQAVRNELFIIYNLDPSDGDPDGWDTINSTWPWMP